MTCQQCVSHHWATFDILCDWRLKNRSSTVGGIGGTVVSMATDSNWLRITIWPSHYFADEPYMEEQIKFNSGPDFFDGFYRRTDVPVDGRATWILECHSDLEGRPGRQVSFKVPTFLRFHAKTGQWVLGRGIGVRSCCNIMTLSDYGHVEEPSDLPSTKWIEKDFKRPVARTVHGLLGRLDCGPLVPARNEDDLVVTIKKIDLQVGTHQLTPDERSHLLADYEEDQFQVRPGMTFPTFPVGVRSNLPHLWWYGPTMSSESTWPFWSLYGFERQQKWSYIAWSDCDHFPAHRWLWSSHSGCTVKRCGLSKN